MNHPTFGRFDTESQQSSNDDPFGTLYGRHSTFEGEDSLTYDLRDHRPSLTEPASLGLEDAGIGFSACDTLHPMSSGYPDYVGGFFPPAKHQSQQVPPSSVSWNTGEALIDPAFIASPYLASMQSNSLSITGNHMLYPVEQPSTLLESKLWGGEATSVGFTDIGPPEQPYFLGGTQNLHSAGYPSDFGGREGVSLCTDGGAMTSLPIQYHPSLSGHFFAPMVNLDQLHRPSYADLFDTLTRQAMVPQDNQTEPPLSLSQLKSAQPSQEPEASSLSSSAGFGDGVSSRSDCAARGMPLRTTQAERMMPALDHAWLLAQISSASNRNFSNFERNMRYLESFSAQEDLSAVDCYGTFVKIERELAQVNNFTTIDTNRPLMKHMNGWLSLLLTAVYSCTAQKQLEGATEKLQHLHLMHMRQRFQYLTTNPVTSIGLGKDCDCLQTGTFMHSSDHGELTHSQRLVKQINNHLEQHVLPFWTPLQSLPRIKRFVSRDRKRHHKQLHKRRGGVTSPKSTDPFCQADTSSTKCDMKDSKLHPWSFNSVSEDFNSGGRPISQSAHGFVQNGSASFSNKTRRTIALKDLDEMPIVNLAWLRRMTGALSFTVAQQCVQHVRILIGHIPWEANHASSRERLDILVGAIDGRMRDLKRCLADRSLLGRIIKWLGLLIVALSDVAVALNKGGSQKEFTFCEELAKAAHNSRYGISQINLTGCDCRWLSESLRGDEGWPLTEMLIIHIDHVLDEFKQNRDKYLRKAQGIRQMYAQ